MRDDLQVLDPFSGEPCLIAELSDAALFYVVESRTALAWIEPQELQKRGGLHHPA